MRCENIPKTVSERKYFIFNTRAVSANQQHQKYRRVHAQSQARSFIFPQPVSCTICATPLLSDHDIAVRAANQRFLFNAKLLPKERHKKLRLLLSTNHKDFEFNIVTQSRNCIDVDSGVFVEEEKPPLHYDGLNPEKPRKKRFHTPGFGDPDDGILRVTG